MFNFKHNFNKNFWGNQEVSWRKFCKWKIVLRMFLLWIATKCIAFLTMTARLKLLRQVIARNESDEAIHNTFNKRICLSIKSKTIFHFPFSIFH